MQNKKTKIDDFDPEADLVDCLPLLPQILARRSRRQELDEHNTENESLDYFNVSPSYLSHRQELKELDRAIIRRAKQLRRDGMTVRKIAETLEDEGFVTQKGTPPNFSTVARYLRS